VVLDSGNRAPAILRPIQRFLRIEAGGGGILLVAALVATVWINSPAAANYQALRAAFTTIRLWHFEFELGLVHLVNDALMTVFFFAVGMEIKRELVRGELSRPARAMLPGIAALGGMVAPVAIFLAFTWNEPARTGWGIPMATDIAFSLAILSMMRGRVPQEMFVFLTALAIVDDIGGILVIAVFYGGGVEPLWLTAAGVVTAGLVVVPRVRKHVVLLDVIGVCALWYVFERGGVHPTLAGVVAGLAVPARSPRVLPSVLDDLARLADALREHKSPDAELEAAELGALEDKLEDVQAPVDILLRRIHPWVGFLVLPLFAFLNAGIELGAVPMSALRAPVVLGTAFGLALGKPIGIAGATWLGAWIMRTGLPGRTSYVQLVGVAAIAGVGFTLALFIAAIAYSNDPELFAGARLGIVLGSIAAATIGSSFLLVSHRLGKARM